MRPQTLTNILMSAFVFLLPALLAGRLAHPSPWLGFVIVSVLLLSQPTPDPKVMVDRSAADKRSAMWIYLGMGLPLIVASVEFAWLRHELPEPMGVAICVGTLVAAVSLAFRIWSIQTLGRFFTATVQVQESQRVIDTGPYRLLRHPSYTGALGTAIGTSILCGSVWGVALVLFLAIPVYLYRMSVEEQTLAAELGEAYVAYMKRTRRLVPFVY